MNRISTIERTFSLQQYNNIKITDTITDIPEKLWKDQDYMRALTYVQLAQIQMSYMRYLDLVNKLENENDQFKFIKDIGAKNLVQLKQEISQEKGE